MSDQSIYLKTGQILKLLGVNKHTWYKWVKTGVAPAGIKLSTRFFVWKREDIEAFLKSAPKVGAAK